MATVQKPNWISTLPSDWALLPVRAVLKERSEKNSKLESDNILSVMKGIGVIRYADKGNVGNKSSDRPEAYKIVRARDIVLNSMNLSIGSLGIACEDGVTSSVYIIYQARTGVANPEFYHYLFQSVPFQRHLASFGRGIMQLREAVKEIDIRNQPVVVPPLKTQVRIVNLLDEKTKIIDQLIAQKERLVELLREKRTALITRAVTKGVDPGVKLKASGVEWLGDIPEGWEAKRLKYWAKNIKEKSTENYDVRIALENIESCTGKLIEASESTHLEGELKRARPNDVLFGKLRPYLAKCFLVQEDSACVGEFLVIRGGRQIVPDFLSYRLLAKDFISYVTGATQGVKMPRVEWDFIGNMHFAIPEVSLQSKILSFLSKKTAVIDEAIKIINGNISKLKEYRSSLIYSAVTGKIKV